MLVSAIHAKTSFSKIKIITKAILYLRSLREPMAANVNQIRPNIHQTIFSFRPPVGANPQNVRF
jgi:hypothetical protein